jgi:hypothetical protein
MYQILVILVMMLIKMVYQFQEEKFALEVGESWMDIIRIKKKLMKLLILMDGYIQEILVPFNQMVL